MKRHMIRWVIMALPIVLAVTGCSSMSYNVNAGFPLSAEKVVDTVFYANGKKKAERILSFGVLNGTSTTWYASGQKRSEVVFSSGLKDGVETIWRKNGQRLTERTYQAGKRNGPFKEWNRAGQQVLDYIYVDDKRDGAYSAWWDNGQKRAAGTYAKGKRVGLCNIWTRDGAIASEVDYPMPKAENGTSTPDAFGETSAGSSTSADADERSVFRPNQ